MYRGGPQDRGRYPPICSAWPSHSVGRPALARAWRDSGPRRVIIKRCRATGGLFARPWRTIRAGGRVSRYVNGARWSVAASWPDAAMDCWRRPDCDGRGHDDGPSDGVCFLVPRNVPRTWPDRLNGKGQEVRPGRATLNKSEGQELTHEEKRGQGIPRRADHHFNPHVHVIRATTTITTGTTTTSAPSPSSLNLARSCSTSCAAQAGVPFGRFSVSTGPAGAFPLICCRLFHESVAFD